MSQSTPQKWFQLEEQFFKGVDRQLMQKLKNEMETAKTAEEIIRVTGINNPHLAEEMAKLHVTVETLAAFRLAPMVAVAWADDRIEENERYTITKAAEESGIAADEPAMALLDTWTKQRPSDELIDAWCEYAAALSSSLAEAHRATLRAEIVEQVHAVAEASGGFLGFGSVSPSEKAMIKRIEAALTV